MSESTSFVKGLQKELGYYVYVYSDPDTGQPFYIGKGTGNRCFDHLFSDTACDKVDKIQSLLNDGKRPKIELLAFGFDTEDEAYRLEAAAIDLIGLKNLTNIKKGHYFIGLGKTDVDNLNANFEPNLINVSDITDNVIVFRMNENFYHGETGHDLYELSRVCWTIKNKNFKSAEYAIVTFKDWVLEVYKIAGWFPAFSTCVRDNNQKTKNIADRYDFVGCIAEESVRNKYLHKVLNDFNNTAVSVYEK